MLCYDKLPLVEAQFVPDIFVSGLAEVHDLGDGNFRFLFFAIKMVDGGQVRSVEAKLICARDNVPPAALKAVTGIGVGFARGLLFPDDYRVH